MLSVYTLEQAEQWDTIVRSFGEHDTYYLSGYVKAFKIHGDGEPLLMHYADSQVRGIHVVMKRDIATDDRFKGLIPENIYFDVTTPYGYGGWLIEGTDSAPLFEAYARWCRKNGIISEFVRFHPVLKNHIGMDQAYDVLALGETVAMDLNSPEEIWANLIGKNRNKVRKAQKNGIRIYSGRYPQIFATFRTIYNGTMDKDNATAYYYFGPEFYESVLNDLSQNAQIFYAVLEDKIIAVSIMLSCNGRMSYHLSGSIQEYANLAPTNLLLHEAALWGCANGCKTLHLGGGVGSGEDSLLKFKKSFYSGPEQYRFHIGRKIFDQDKYDQLTQMRTDLPESNFFPKYRA